jgi:hypothetical protein
MTSDGRPGAWGRLWSKLGGALRRGLLGRSGHDYTKQFTGSDEYWERAIAAQLGWPRQQPRQPDPGRPHSPAPPVLLPGPGVGDTARRSSA